MKFIKYDCANEKILKDFFNSYFKKNKCPNVFINASYPITKDWKKNTFKDINFNSYKKNIEIHLNSYIWTAKIIADEMKKNKVKGSIIQLSSIYLLYIKKMKKTRRMNKNKNQGGGEQEGGSW